MAEENKNIKGRINELAVYHTDAYAIAVANGYKGTVAEWLDSLVGKSAYDIAVQLGFKGTEKEWLDSLTQETADKAEAMIAAQKEAALRAVAESSKTATDAATVAREAADSAAATSAEAKASIEAAEQEAVAHIESMAEESLGIVQTTGDSETAVMSQKAVTAQTGTFPVVKSTTTIEASETVGAVLKSNGVITETTSTNWRHAFVPVEENSYYLISTGHYIRSVLSDYYVHPCNDNKEVTGTGCLDTRRTEGYAQSEEVLYYTPTGTTQLAIMRYQAYGLQISVRKVNSFFNNAKEAAEYLGATNEAAKDTIVVGVASDFKTINSALDYASKLHLANKHSVNIILSAGFVMQEQVTIDKDLSFCKISCMENYIHVDGNYITENNIDCPAHTGYAAVKLKCAFAIVNGGKSPVFACKFRAINNTSFVGMGAYNGSSITVLQGGGFDRANVNLYLLEGSRGNCAGADFSSATATGVNVFRQCHLEFGGGTAKNCAVYGAYFDSASVGDVCGANFSGSGEIGVYIGLSSVVAGEAMSANECGTGVYTYTGAKFSGRNMSVNQCATGVRAISGSEIVCMSSNIKNATANAVIVETGGKINCAKATLTGYGARGVYCSDGIIYANQVITGDTARNTDIVCNSGMIFAYNATGGTNITPNTLTASGVILK